MEGLDWLAGIMDESGQHTSGTSLDTILLARPSRIAVLPTPGGPMSCRTVSKDHCGWWGLLTTGLDFVRRERTVALSTLVMIQEVVY